MNSVYNFPLDDQRDFSHFQICLSLWLRWLGELHKHALYSDSETQRDVPRTWLTKLVRDYNSKNYGKLSISDTLPFAKILCSNILVLQMTWLTSKTDLSSR